jgi:hypothetical protein
LERLVASFKFPRVKWAIKDGCPGPKAIAIDDDILLVTINTQWWNHPYDKPGPADADCKISVDENFMEELEDLIEENADKNLLIAGHFPIFSLGEYGGHLPLQAHLLPLPLIGSFYAGYRQNVGTTKDIANTNFARFRKRLEDIITYRHGLIYLSGHEHNLQILKKEDNYFINSGAPATAKFAAHDRSALFSRALPGLIELVYCANGQVDAVVHAFTEATGFEANSPFNLYQSACAETNGKMPVNTAYIPCQKKPEFPKKMSGRYDTLTTAIAGKEYAAGGLKRLFFGAHYRDSWTANVRVPYLDLDTTFGGLTPYKKGGGRQTKSLKFNAANGRRYVFRSVNKDPVKALDYSLRETIVADVVRDQTSTQQPYGAMAADVMLNELGVLHAHPQLYVLPDDDKLGPFKTEYGNLLGMLEENPFDPKPGEKAFAGANEILRSYELFRKLYQDHDNYVDDKNFAVARVFDILSGDWGKHEDNWKWAGYKQGKKTLYKPIPRDRDHVFSRWDGILPWLADREWAKPTGENFGYDITGIRSLTSQARHLDRLIANELSKDDWLEAAKLVQEKITDEVIAQAVKNMPEEIYALSGKTIEAKLRARVKHLDRDILKYYALLAKEVDVVGSNKREYFEVTRNPDGSVSVAMYEVSKKDENAKGDELFYFRKFYPKETKEIRLFGLDGKDVFDIKGESENSITIRVVGGPGADIIHERSKVGSSGRKTLIYERSKRGDIFLGEEGKMVASANDAAYNYDRRAFAYNTYLPLPYFAYNADDGFLFNFGLQFTRQKYGKDRYSSKHSLQATAATSGTYSFEYAARFHQVFGNWDVELGGLVARPNHFTNFFGIGNDTRKDDDLYRRKFYKTRYDSYQLTAGLVRDFWKYSRLVMQLHYENNEGQIDKSKTLFGEQDFFGSEKINLAEGVIGLDLDVRDNANLPTRGARLVVSHHNGVITNNGNSNYGQTLAFIEHFSTKRILLPFTLGLKAGGGDSYGEIPFYKQFALGQNTFLRGFRNNRFTGASVLFFNSELRMKLFDLHTQIVPMQVGVKGFFDSGKIVEDKPGSTKWHNGYGFGIFIVPLEARFALNASVGFSDEETVLLRFGLGTTFK